MSNHGKVGKALYVKFTPEKLLERMKGDFKHGDILNIEYLQTKNVWSSVPIHIDENTQGEYECVCEFGTEIW